MKVQRGVGCETEIKLLVPDIAQMIRRLRHAGAKEHGRVFERNCLYDTPESGLRQRGCLLRLRREAPAPSATIRGGKRRCILTFKSLGPKGTSPRYKHNLESEREVRDSRQWASSFRFLGLRPGFRYEKYRTTFRFRGIDLMLDETPAGNFLEIEGSPSAIDLMARLLGYSPGDYIRATYWDLHARSRTRGKRLGNMMFLA